MLAGGAPLSMALPRMALDEYLPTKRITFGKKALELRGVTQDDTRFGAMLSIREYPPYTGAGMLDGLLRIPHEMIVSQSFALEDRAPVMSHVAKVQRQISASDEAGTEVEAAINIARNELVTGQTVLGYHHLTVCALGKKLRDHGKLRSGGDAGVAEFRDDRRPRGYERRAVFLGAIAGEFRLYRAQGVDLLAQFRRLRLIA